MTVWHDTTVILPPAGTWVVVRTRHGQYYEAVYYSVGTGYWKSPAWPGFAGPRFITYWAEAPV